MALVINRPPARRNLRTAEDTRRVYTLHSTPNKIFAWRTENKSMKTAAVVFRRHEDAALMAYMIEQHVRQKKEWPPVNILDFELESGPNRLFKSELVEIRPWNIENLKVHCVTAYLDMVTLNKLIPNETGFRINGELISLNMPMEFHINHLRHLLELE
jgi:hypothetical protein